MFNRKIESRSQSIMNMALPPLITEYPFQTIPFVSPKLLELYNLFSQEETLAALIADDKKVVDKDTVYKIVASARKIAAKGYPTTLVSTDELLDIAQIYISATDPGVAANLLVELLSNIKETGNPAWTARVAAALAYYSVDKQSRIEN